MLNLQRWLFKLQNPHWEMKWPHWDVFDPDTQVQVGVVRVDRKALKGFFRFKWLNPLFELRSVPDDSHVCSLYRQVRLWRPALQVWNSSGELVGYFKRKRFSINGGYWVYDGQHQRFGEVHADWTDYEFRLIGSAGEELGRVSRKLVGLSRAFLYNERDFLVTASDGCADDPESKKLLLATALAASGLSR
jgi:hypothetical protein